MNTLYAFLFCSRCLHVYPGQRGTKAIMMLNQGAAIYYPCYFGQNLDLEFRLLAKITFDVNGGTAFAINTGYHFTNPGGHLGSICSSMV